MRDFLWFVSAMVMICAAIAFFYEFGKMQNGNYDGPLYKWWDNKPKSSPIIDVEVEKDIRLPRVRLSLIDMEEVSMGNDGKLIKRTEKDLSETEKLLHVLQGMERKIDELKFSVELKRKQRNGKIRSKIDVGG